MLDKIKQLREMTLASVAICREAITEAAGDLDKAAEIILRRGARIAEKKAGRATAQGLIEAYVHSNGRIGALLELNCETDFVARNELFKQLAHDLAMHVTAMNPKYLSAAYIPEEVIEEERRIYREEFTGSGKPENVIAQIIEGKLKKHQEEICLLSQPFVKDQDKTVEEIIHEYVGKLGENIKIKRFIRFEI